jgi:diaminohydroxyphosphoribosylaminopyrimidine deaminase/5-amino-6-(5-phosphoribosylamino)uracil reductase
VTFSGFDHECMARAFSLARKGLYTTDPNPRVGCVIASEERIVGSGWHAAAGSPHAEVEALAQAGEAARGSTAYVTLEPCNHQGRTPPCTQALLEAGVSRVVIAGKDPNPGVVGNGRARLAEAGVVVESGLMAEEAESLNPGFLMRMRKGRPWIRVKTAISLDGRTALRNGDSQWISSEASRQDVQRWRARSSAILTGSGTVLADDPSMNARVDGPVEQPTRVIVDSQWRTPPDGRMFDTPGPVIIAGNADVEIPGELAASAARCLPMPVQEGGINLHALMSELAGLQVNELQVEAGGRLCGALLNAQLIDEILVYQAPVLLGSGCSGPFAFGPLESMADRTHLKVLETCHLGEDLRIRLQPESEF